MRLQLTLALATLGLAGTLATGCEQKMDGPQPVVDNPSTSADPAPIDPGIICRDQRISDVVINGSGMSPVPIDVPNNPRTALPTVLLTRGLNLDGSAGDGLEVTYNGDPDNPQNVPLLSWQSQRQMTFVVVPPCSADADCTDGYVCHPTAGVCAPSADADLSGMMEEGVYDVRVTNPNSHDVVSSGSLAVIGRPTLNTTQALTPPIVCLAQGDRQVTLAGSRFLTINQARANVTIDSVATPFEIDTDGFADCTQIPHEGYDTLQYCSTATMTLATDSVPIGYPGVIVNNPETAACITEEVINLRVVPPPAITAMAEIGEDQAAVAAGDGTIVCSSEGTRDVVIHGTDFLEIDGVLPAVTLDGTSVVTKDIDGCEDLPTMDLTVRRCTRLTIEITTALAATNDPYQPVVEFTNPAPAGCNDTTTDRLNLLTIAPPPEVISVEPPLICIDESNEDVVVEGANFLSIDGTPPTVEFDTTVIDSANVSPQQCSALDVGGKTVERCTELLVTLIQGGVAPGQPDLTVTNPMPAGCSDTGLGLLTVVPAPSITTIDPLGLCANSAGVTTLTISGQGFLTVDGTQFELLINNAPVTPDSVTDCTDLNVDGMAVQSCDTITVTYDFTGFPVGPVPFAINNPPPADCATVETDMFQLSDPPTVTDVQPPELCSDVVNDTATLTGTNFASNASVTLTGANVGDIPANEVTVNWVSDTQIDLVFPNGLPADTYDITVSNGTNCESTLTAGLIVHPTPLVFFVDPPVVYNGITTEVTVYATGLDQLAAAVELIDSGGTVTALTTFSNPDPTKPNRILAEVPAALAAGTYEVSVTSAYNCVSSLNGELVITDTLTLDLAGIDPAFASPTEATAVTVTSTDPAPAGFVNFAPVPRVYLSPSGNPDAAATAVRATILEDQFTLNGIIPGGLVSGTYNLIAVNPSGEVGLINDAVVVTVGEPPFVTSIAPATLDSNTVGQSASIFGKNFTTDAGNTSVTFACQDFETGASVPAPTAVVDTADAGELALTVDGTGVPAGSVCVVTVTNPDGASYNFSALTFKEPSQNLNPWAAGPDMLEARRGPSAAAGRPTDRSRFLYAVGGDDGAATGAKDTIEYNPIGIFGGMDPTWTYQRNDLSNVWNFGSQATEAHPRTFGELVRVENFFYLIGGDDGSGSQPTVLRAQILQPQGRPGDQRAGRGAGRWRHGHR